MTARSAVAVRGLPPELVERSRRRTLVMGVLNVTPDSFSDGGEFLDPVAAVTQGLRLLQDGADLLDVGGESTRPGAVRVPWDVETARVRPVIAELVGAGAVVSVDTMSARTAAAALEAGATVVNDVSGGLADPDLPRVVADAGCPYVVMHWRGHSDRMQDLATYDDVVADVTAELAARLDAVVAAGVDIEQVVLDPGLGFAKNAEHNWALLAAPEPLRALGRPVLMGASRKRFLGTMLDAAGLGSSPRDRDDATAAVSALVAAQGAWGVRVHDVRGTRAAVAVAAELRAAEGRS